MLVAPAIVALRLSGELSLASALVGVTDEIERDRITASFVDFRSDTGGILKCVPSFAVLAALVNFTLSLSGSRDSGH